MFSSTKEPQSAHRSANTLVKAGKTQQKVLPVRAGMQRGTAACLHLLVPPGHIVEQRIPLQLSHHPQQRLAGHEHLLGKHLHQFSWHTALADERGQGRVGRAERPSETRRAARAAKRGEAVWGPADAIGIICLAASTGFVRETAEEAHLARPRVTTLVWQARRP